MSSRYPIVIIGGGPAGLSAALAACRAGAESVVVVERKREWGVPVQCAGYAPRLLGRSVPFDGRAVRCGLDSLELHLDGELLKTVRAPGYVLRRDVFERQLADAVRAAGGGLIQPAHAVEIDGNRVMVEAKGERSTIEAGIIIAADGPRSLTRRALGLPDPKLAVGLEWELPTAAKLDAAEIHFAHAYGAGYAWLFPHGDTTGAGLAIDRGQPGDLKAMLREFVGQMVAAGKLRDAEPIRAVSGFIPVSGPVETTVAGRVLLVGDAAGQTNPLTGAGLMSAVAAGEMAGRAAAEAARADDLSRLDRYEDEWRDLLGRFLDRALAGRDAMAEAGAGEYGEATRKAWGIRERCRRS